MRLMAFHLFYEYSFYAESNFQEDFPLEHHP